MKNGNGLKKVGYYVVKGQDPMIAVLKAVKKSDKVSDAEIRRMTDDNIATSTMGNWWKGKTRFPQLKTIATCSLALGLDHIPLTAEGREKIIQKYK